METDNTALVRGASRAEASGLGARSGAALLDLLVAYAILVTTSWAWMFFADPSAIADERPAPWYVTAIVAGLVWLYLTGTVAGGRTLGMRVARLRVLRADNAGSPGTARAAGRSLVLVAVCLLLLQVHPVLVVAYPLLMLVIPDRRLPHDLVAGTVVTSAVAPTAAAAVQPISQHLDPGQARNLVADLDNLRRRSASDLHRASVPLIVLGLLALAGAAVEGLRDGDLFVLGWLFWVAAGPVGLLVTAWWYRRFRLRDGAGPGEADIVVIAVLVGCAALAGAFLPLGAVITAAGFLAVAVTRRSRVLAAAAIVFGVVVGLEQPFHALSLGIGDNAPHLPVAGLVEAYGTSGIFAVLGMVLLLAGSLALRREQAG